jgi:hypothetical protein
MGCRWMRLKILDSMLLRQMFFWILLGSTTSLPLLNRKLYNALLVHMNFILQSLYKLLFISALILSLQLPNLQLISVNFLFFSLPFLFSGHSWLKVQISVVLERDTSYMFSGVTFLAIGGIRVTNLTNPWTNANT